MKKLLLVSLLVLTAVVINAQQNISLSFSAVQNTTYLPFDSIKIVNQTQACDTTLYWPDTLLNYVYVGIRDLQNDGERLAVFQNHPNPVSSQTIVTIYSPANQNIEIRLRDISGKTEIVKTWFQNKGSHNFVFTPGNSPFYIFSVSSENSLSSIKISNTSTRRKSCKISYQGMADNQFPERGYKSTNNDAFVFAPGDKLFLTAFHDTLASGMVARPQGSEIFSFQFAYNIPCPGMPLLVYEGKTYHTVQIFNQCWLKENLDVGEIIPSGQPMSHNGVMEKYCYDNSPANCEAFGGLYQWDELMQYTNEPGSPGICPPGGGWHVPTDEEWMLLEGNVDSQFGICDSIWNTIYYRGFDAGNNLKSKSGWNNNINGIDRYGFKALPGGLRLADDSFSSLLFRGYWATSSEYMGTELWRHYMGFNFDNVGHSSYEKEAGYSVRCLHN